MSLQLAQATKDFHVSNVPKFAVQPAMDAQQKARRYTAECETCIASGGAKPVSMNASEMDTYLTSAGKALTLLKSMLDIAKRSVDKAV